MLLCERETAGETLGGKEDVDVCVFFFLHRHAVVEQQVGTENEAQAYRRRSSLQANDQLRNSHE